LIPLDAQADATKEDEEAIPKDRLLFSYQRGLTSGKGSGGFDFE
jgi:hypothetical protein